MPLSIRGVHCTRFYYKGTPLQQTGAFVILSLLWALRCGLGSSMMLASNSVAPPFALNVQVHVKPDRREEFLEIIQYDAEETMRQEKGALQFTVGQSTTDSTMFHFHEQYQTLKDFENHQATEHFQKWKAFCDTDPFVSDLICQEYYLLPPSVHYTPKVLPSDEVFCLNVELCIKKSVREEFLSVIENNEKGSLTSEPLCRQYVYGESTTTPNTFYFHEQYSGKERGQEGFQAHKVSAHFQVWEEFAAQSPFTKDPVVSFFQSIFNEVK
jgi:(4S)-4-hydroxy-5-phosphonooxypentane-2,3-dione isomerase